MKRPRAYITEVRSTVAHSGVEITELELWIRHRNAPGLLFRTVGHATPWIRAQVEYICAHLNGGGAK